MPEKTGATMLLGLGLLAAGRMATTEPNVSCLIEGQDVVQCIWSGPYFQGVNYSFQSRFANEVLSWCTTYIQDQGITIGCHQTHKDSFNKRFRTFYTLLTHKNKTFLQEHNILHKVRLSPPANITVISSNKELRLHWSNSPLGACVQSEVRHRKQGLSWQQTVLNQEGRTDFLISSLSSRERYELQVRNRVGKHCQTSMFWSGWSPPAYWGPLENSTEDRGTQGFLVSWEAEWMLGVVGCTLLLLLALLTCSERLRTCVVPVLPSPSRNLSALIEVHHGNVEEWLHISKELKEGFKSNYLELPCTVRDYSSQPNDLQSYNSLAVHDVHSTTSSISTDQSDGCMSNLTDHSECLSIHCCSSTSCSCLA